MDAALRRTVLIVLAVLVTLFLLGGLATALIAPA